MNRHFPGLSDGTIIELFPDLLEVLDRGLEMTAFVLFEKWV
jgi:hypothetical protein